MYTEFCSLQIKWRSSTHYAPPIIIRLLWLHFDSAPLIHSLFLFLFYQPNSALFCSHYKIERMMNAKERVFSLLCSRAIEADEAIANECCHRTPNNIMDDRVRAKCNNHANAHRKYVCTECRHIEYGGAYKPQSHF